MHTWPPWSFSGRVALFCGTSARRVVSATRVYTRGGSPFSSLGTPPKQCRVNLILIRARDSKRVDNIGESAEEKERENSRERCSVLRARAPAGTRDESFSVSCCTSSSRSISVVSRLRGYFPHPYFLSSLWRFCSSSRLASARPISHSRSRERCSFVFQRKDADTPNYQVIGSLCCWNRTYADYSEAKCTNANGAFYRLDWSGKCLANELQLLLLLLKVSRNRINKLYNCSGKK